MAESVVFMEEAATSIMFSMHSFPFGGTGAGGLAGCLFAKNGSQDRSIPSIQMGLLANYFVIGSSMNINAILRLKLHISSIGP